MPRLLKNETRQRLDVAQRSLRLAFQLLATPKAVGHERMPTDGAIEMGLIGVSAELAIAACLYEILGKQGVLRAHDGFYLTASEALAKFRSTTSSAIASLDALTAGVPDPAAYLNKVDTACAGFSVIFTARATALHAGAGVAYDIGFSAGKTVADFLCVLAESPKWKPYLREIPAVPALPKDRMLIAQELATALAAKEKTVGAAVTGVFLVLPELTPQEPDWLKALAHAQVTPRGGDITILIKSLQSGKVGEITKVGKGPVATPVRIAPDDPNAIPIYPTAMKKKFEKAHDQWAAYIASANGEIDKKILSLPPRESLYGFSALGIDGIGLPEGEITAGLPAHSVWPFVAAALYHQGTPGPCFFVIKAMKQTELGQLEALLGNAAKVGRRIAKPLAAYLPLIRAAVECKPVSVTEPLAKELTATCKKREEQREKLSRLLQTRRGQSPVASHAGLDSLIALAENTDSLELPLSKILANEIFLGDCLYPVAKLLVEACSEREDLRILTAVEADANVAPAHTDARKAIRELDYKFFGPQAQ